MKLVIALLLFFTIQTSANSYAQKISILKKNVHLSVVFKAIQKQTGYVFFYDKDLIQKTSPIDIAVKNVTLEQALSACLKNEQLTYSIVTNTIVIQKKKASIFDVSSEKLAPLPPLDISGKVIDKYGTPLAGVSVFIKGMKIGATTDNEGRFVLTVADEKNITLEFSSIGFQTKTVAIGAKREINITLEEDISGLEGVVVVGYGVQKKTNLTGAVAVADKKVFENKAVPSATAALQGALAGVTVTQSSGKPGSEGLKIEIRGLSSANTVNALVLVDGVVGSINDINPNDIESVTVLKDAAASSIYGSNAAGGVILITTKKGQSGKTKVQYSGMVGITNPSRMPERLPSWVEMDMYSQAQINAGRTARWDRPTIDWMKGENLDVYDTRTGVRPMDFFPGKRFYIEKSRPNVWMSADNVDMIKETTKGNNPFHSHNVSLSGGTEKSSYFLSAGYYYRRGIMRYGEDSDDRYNLRLNLDQKVAKKISVRTSVAYTNKNIYQPATTSESILLNAYKRWGNIPTYDPDGNYLAGNGIWASLVQEEKEGGQNKQNRYMFEGNINLKIKDITPGLTFDILASKRIGSNKQLVEERTLTYIGPLGTPTLIVRPTNTLSKNFASTNYSSVQAFATYKLTISENHNFSLLGGYSFEDYREESISAGANNLVTNDFFSLNWGSPNTKSNEDAIYTSATMAGFGRLNYSYKDRYLFEANFRYDGSSKLASSTRWNAFPSLSAGWNIGNESFFKNINFIQNLKIRGSWGRLGNSDALGYYDYIGLLNRGSNLPFNNAPTQYIYQNTLASETKTWETIETTNIGLDFTALNGKLSFSGDIYDKKNKNMLAFVEAPAIIGVGLPTYNVGELQTKGWEFEITWREKKQRLNYWVSFNLSDNQNKLIKYEGRNIVQAGATRLIEGMPLNTLWGYETGGLFQSDKEYADYGVKISPNTGGGDMKYIDRNNDKVISVGNGSLENHGDLVLLGDDNPRYIFGANFGFEWNGFDFGAFFQGIGKRKFFVSSSDILQPMSSDSRMPMKHHLNYWTADNPNAYWPRLFAGSDHSYLPSDYWVQNGAYIRLKNIQLGYTLPLSITQRAKIDKARFYISGQDLWEYTKVFDFLDPEIPNNSSIVYPFFRSVSIGLNLTF